MKIIFKIARAELRSLFYAPIAWIIIVIFFVITGMQFVAALREMAKVQEILTENMPGYAGDPEGLTLKIFQGSIGKVLSYFYMFVPLLTMGVVSREFNAGTMKLLYSSPIRIRELVLGKFLGLMIFNCVLLFSVAVLLFTGALSILHVETPIYLSMLLGLFLLSNTYMAIGLFISCLTSYQIVAGIITYVVFVLLSMIGGWGQGYDFVRDLTYFMSISGRVESMIYGLITSRNIFYYILIMILFVGLTLIKLKSTQESRKWTVSFLRYTLFSGVILILGYFSSRPGNVAYLDVTRDKTNTIDPNTQEVLKELDGSLVTVTLYANLLDNKVMAGLPESRNNYIWNFWEKYLRFYPNIQFKYEYYYKNNEDEATTKQQYGDRTLAEIAAMKARLLDVDLKRFKTPEEIEKKIDLTHEPATLFMELEYKGVKSVLRTFDQPLWPPQTHVAAAIRRLVRDSIPKVLFTTGHYERSIRKYGEREYTAHTSFKGSPASLLNYGVDVDTIALASQKIDPHTTLLVIADPKSAFEVQEAEQVITYLQNGGNAFFYCEPGKQVILNTILQHIGVHLEDGVILNQHSPLSPLDISGPLTDEAHKLSREEVMQRFFYNKKHKAGAFFFGATEISFQEIDGFKIDPIWNFEGKDKVWREKGYVGLDSAQATFSAAEGDIQKQQYLLGIKMTRTINGKEQRIIVMGDADYMSHKHLHNNLIGVGLYSWLLYNEYPVYRNVYVKKDVFLTIGKEAGNRIWVAYVYVLPGLLLLSGLVIVIRRSRK